MHVSHFGVVVSWSNPASSRAQVDWRGAQGQPLAGPSELGRFGVGRQHRSGDPVVQSEPDAQEQVGRGASPEERATGSWLCVS